jgi:hypothetical protein
MSTKSSDRRLIFSRYLLNAEEKEKEIYNILGPTGVTEKLFNSDTWIIDWCTENAVIFSQIKPKKTKLIIRIHRYDAFSWYAFLVKWENVDGLIFVSDTIRRIFTELHGENIKHIRIVVARNGIIGEFAIAKPRSKVIGLLQYGTMAKDPLFALEILKYFLSNDSEWRLCIAGPQFDATYSDTLRKRFFDFIIKNDLQNAIVLEGYQENPKFWFSRMSFILSSSQSEGSHEAIREGVHLGCVPLIRNWPAIKDYGGAYGAYPELHDFIFETPEEAYRIASKSLGLDSIKVILENNSLSLSNIKVLL